MFRNRPGINPARIPAVISGQAPASRLCRLLVVAEIVVLCALMGCTLAFMICLVGIKGENLVQSKIRWNDKQP